jgi:opacity protein-like surface antigen
MKVKTLFLAAAAVTALAVAPAASEAAAKPGFPAGTWTGKGVISGTSSEYGQTTRTTGRASFTLNVTRGGRVSGTGRWVTTEVGSGAISSTIRGVANVRFGGTATLPTYAGPQTVTTSFSDPVHDDGTTFVAKKTFRGALRITRAGHCRVIGSRTVDGVSFKWTALLKGSGTCNT